MKTLLVTGGCGFIGSHFVQLLLRQTDWRVLNLDKLTYAGGLENLTDIREGSRYHFVQGDISDRTLMNRLFKEEKPWAVVNFAAESHVDRSIRLEQVASKDYQAYYEAVYNRAWNRS